MLILDDISGIYNCTNRFKDGDEIGTTLAITDREEVPPGTDLEKAMIDLGEELLRPPEERSRARRKVFASEAELVGTPHATEVDYPNSKDRARSSRLSTEDPLHELVGTARTSLSIVNGRAKSNPNPNDGASVSGLCTVSEVSTEIGNCQLNDKPRH